MTPHTPGVNKPIQIAPQLQGDIIKHFSYLHPLQFKCLPNSKAAEVWLKQLEKKFEALNCTPE